MKVTVEDRSSVKKVLHIEIPEADVTRALDDAYQTLKKTAKVKGFRPGKTPRGVLERLYKKDVNDDIAVTRAANFCVSMSASSLAFLSSRVLRYGEIYCRPEGR